MANIIDELIVKLGLDSSDIESKAPTATKKLKELDDSAAGVEGSSKAAATGLSEFAGKLGAFLALLGGTVALKTFISDTVETNTQLFYLAANLGIAVGSLSAWGTVAAQFGGSAKGLEGTLSHLSQEATNFALRGQSSLLPFLSVLGVRFDQVHPERMLEGIAEGAERLQKAGLPRPAVHNILQQIGIDEGTINAILNGTAALKAYLEQARKLAVSPDEAQHAAEATAKLVLLGAQYRKIGIDLLELVLPALTKFTGLLQRFGAWVQAHETIAAVFAAITLTVGGLTAGFVALVSVAGLLGVALPAIGVAFDLLLGPIGLVLAAITAIIAGVTWLATRKTIGAGVGSSAPVTSENVPDLAKEIARQEGFYKPGSIPQRNNNPGDIEYGPFAQRHGATGATIARDPDTGEPHQIAVFSTEAEGWAAMNALLASASYLGLSQSDAIRKWQGKGAPQSISSMLNGKANDIGSQLATIGSASPSVAPISSRSITNHIGAIHVHTQATDAKKMAADLGRGTDWLTFASQANSAVT